MTQRLNSRLYKLLRIDPNADPEELKQNYKVESMRAVHREGYHILSNGDRKRVYDIGGENIVDGLQGQQWGPVVTTLGSRCSLFLYGLFLFLFIAMAAMFFAFLAAKVDGLVNWSWVQVVSPVIVVAGGFLIVALIAFFCGCCNPHYHEGRSRALFAFEHIALIICALCYVCFVILCGLTLMNVIEAKWRQYFCVLIIGDVIHCFSLLLTKYPRRVE